MFIFRRQNLTRGSEDLENKIMIPDTDLLMEESLEKIYGLLEEKKYFQARDELLKYNAVDIAEMLEEITEEYDYERSIVLFRLLPKAISDIVLFESH